MKRPFLVLMLALLPLISQAQSIECDRIHFFQVSKVEFLEIPKTHHYKAFLVYDDGTTEPADFMGQPVYVSKAEIAGSSTKRITRLKGYDLIVEFSGGIDKMIFKEGDECTETYQFNDVICKLQ